MHPMLHRPPRPLAASEPGPGELPRGEIGEVCILSPSNTAGYWKLPEATAKTIDPDGWLHTGDAGIMDDDGYVYIQDRIKDMIISGGENISSVEVEGVLMGHPDVLLAAVVAKPDEKWGEVPGAFGELKPGAAEDADALIAFARRTLAGFKTPKHVVFAELPKTSTGKIQKFELRKQARDMP